MPTAQDLERLRALLQQLDAISAVRRGELIRAEDWNSLVLAVADIARSVLAADAAVAVAAHEHQDQVGLAWLTPQLRDLIERGPLSDPAFQKRLTDIEQTLRRISEKQDRNDGDVKEFRGRLTDVATRDLEREAAVSSVRRAIDGIADPRAELQNFRTTLGTIQKDMTTVLEAASRLETDEGVVDLPALVKRVTELESLRERLRFANGELLDAATIESRIARIENRTVTPAQLDEAIRTRPATLSQDQLAELETRFGANIREQTNTLFEGLRGEIRTDVNTRLAGVGDLVAGRVNDALPGLTETLTASLQTRIDAAQRAAVEQAARNADRAITASAQATQEAIAAQIDEVREGIPATVRTEVTQRVTAEVASLRASLEANTRRLDDVTAQSNRIDATQREHATALARVPQDIAAVRNELRQSLLGEIDLRTSALTRSIDERLSSFEKTQNERFAALSRDVQTQAVDAARKAAIETAQSESRSIRTQLLAEMRGIAKEEVTLALRDHVRVAVTDAVKEQFAAVPGLVAAEVRRATQGNRPVIPGPITGPITGGPR